MPSAIETEYAGCRFRSRLEARWAVFFDHLDTPWEYEPQGLDLPSGRYLPDFWLPDMGIWAEVKGVFTHQDFIKLMDAVPHLLEPVGQQIQPRLLILGPVPRPGSAWVHTRVDVFRDTLLWQQVFFAGPHWHTKPIHQASAIPFGAFNRAEEELTDWFRTSALDPGYDPRLTVDPAVDDAYRAARSARFEFGESGG